MPYKKGRDTWLVFSNALLSTRLFSKAAEMIRLVLKIVFFLVHDVECR